MFRTTINRKRGTVTRSVSTPIQGLSYVETQKITRKPEDYKRKDMAKEHSPTVYRVCSFLMKGVGVLALLLGIVAFATANVLLGAGMLVLAGFAGLCVYTWRDKCSISSPSLMGDSSLAEEIPESSASIEESSYFASEAYQPKKEWLQKPPAPKSREEAAILVKQLLRQAGESADILNRTTDPSVFFRRYDFMIGCLQGLAECERYIPLTGRRPDQQAKELCNPEKRDAVVLEMIQRCYGKSREKIAALKTQNAKKNAANRFAESLLEFSDCLSEKAITVIEEDHQNLLRLAMQEKTSAS